MKSLYRPLAVCAALALIGAGCGSDGPEVAGVSTERATVVVSTNILGDIVENLTGDQFNVVTIMPVGADPHDFQASAQQVATIGEADVLIVNGAGFEEGLLDVIEAAEGDGVAVFEAISAVETIDFGEGAHGDEHGDEDDDEEHGDEGEEHSDEDEEHSDEDEEHSDEDEEHSDEDEEHSDEDKEHSDEDEDEAHGDEDEEHGDEDDEHGDEDDEEHGDEDEHGDHDGEDPHFFTDPARMAVAAEAIVEFLLANAKDVDADALTSSARQYVDELESLDAEVAETLAAVSEDRRVLVTNHEVFGYFADRYGFEVAGTVIPAGSTSDTSDARQLAELSELIEAEGVPAIFADTSSSDELAQTLASEVGDIEIVELYSESLGADDSEGATYTGMVRTNAKRIADALTS